MSGTRLIRVGEDLLLLLGTRTDDGRKITFTGWGEPTERVLPVHYDYYGEPEAVFTPVFTATDDGTHLCRCKSESAHQEDLVRA